MARLLGPDAASRLITQTPYEYSGRLATVYSDAAGTQLADIATWDGSSTPGASISGSQVRLDSGSRLPKFWFPTDGTDVLYAQPYGGPLVEIRADVRTDSSILAAAALGPTLRIRPVRPTTVITTFQPGHGWSTAGSGVDSGNSNVNDTSTFALGTQCATVVTNGTGPSTTAYLRRVGFNPPDFTSKVCGITLKVDDMTHLNKIAVYFSQSNNTGQSYNWVLFSTSAVTYPVITSGDWVTLLFGQHDMTTSGSPTGLNAINDIQIAVVDDGVAPVTVHVQQVFYAADAATVTPGTQYPNGVVTFSFDDCWQSVWDLALPKLASYGYAAANFVICDVVGGTARVNVGELLSLQDNYGWEISAHAYSDADHTTAFPALAAAGVLENDFASMRAWLVGNGLRGQGLAYPLGGFNAAVISSARKYWAYARTIAAKTKETLPVANPYRVRALSAISTASGASWTPSQLTTPSTGQIALCAANKSLLNLVFHRIIPTVSSVTVSSNVATVTFAARHPFSNGQTVVFAGFTPSGLNGSWTVQNTNTNTTTLQVAVTGSPGNGTVMGTILRDGSDIAVADFNTIVDTVNTAGCAVRTLADAIT